jgi:hypothetical protein
MPKSKRLAGLVAGLALSLAAHAQEGVSAGIALTDPDLSGPGEAPAKDAPIAAPKSARFTVGHEVSDRIAGQQGLINNRSWFRVEYSKFFLDSLFVQVDTKVNGYWHNDHRARAEDRSSLFESNTQEAFLQYSGAGGESSLKVGVQRLIWGESEGGAITDVVSPRNFSELFVIPLEESRVGQFMVNLDRFSARGDWSFFWVPKPKFNKYSKPGTAYYIDPFNGLADYHDVPYEKSRDEYGMRWRKTFGKSDISFMAASLMDNDDVVRLDSVDANGRLSIARLKQRFSLAGMTFNYAAGEALFKGELAWKSPRMFNDSAFQLLKRDVIDSALGVTYSVGQSNTVGLELVNSHVNDWSAQLSGVARNTSSLVANTNLFFLHDTLSVNWLLIYNRPATSYLSSVRSTYKWNDNTKIGVDLHLVGAPAPNSALRPYRDQDQILVRLQYQF